MPAKLPQQDFTALVRGAGLELSSTETDELYGAWANVEPMLDRIRGGATRPRGVLQDPRELFRVSVDGPTVPG